MPWDFVTPDGPEPPAGDLVLLPDLAILSDAEAERLRAWKCRIHAYGAAGVLDERGAEREDPVFPDAGEPALAGPLGIKLADGLVETAVAPDGGRLIHLIRMDNQSTLDELRFELPFDADAVRVYSFESGVTAELVGRTVTVRKLKTLATLKFSPK